MDTRKITKIMLSILFVLLLVIAIKIMQGSMTTKKVEVDTNVEDNNGEVNIEEGGEYDKDQISFKGFEYLYDMFETFEEGDKCMLDLQDALVNYGTPTRFFVIENPKLEQNILSFEIASENNASSERYAVVVSEKKTVVARIDEKQ